MILVMSGGLDSVMAWRLLDLPPAVRFLLGTRSESREELAVRWAESRFGQKVAHRPIPMGNLEQANGYVPFRNALLIITAAQYDGDVALGQIAEWCPDKNRRFYRRLERAVNARGSLAGSTKRLRVHTPFAALSKGQLLALYAETFGTVDTLELLVNTWSCYGDGETHCGECGACVQRYNAECRWAGKPVTRYRTPPQQVHIPKSDFLRWVRDNGRIGLSQVRQHERDREAGKNATPRPTE